MASTRIERDTFGPIEVPSDRLWGAQTQRSLHHFAISGERMPRELIAALALVKKAAALVNLDLGSLDEKKGRAIIAAASPSECPLVAQAEATAKLGPCKFSARLTCPASRLGAI